MSKENQRIIVVKRESLFGEDFFEGFRPASEIDYESRIISNMEVMRRGTVTEPANHPLGNAEMNPAFKQPIGYAIIYNPLIRKVFAYQRAPSSKDQGEERLQEKWSWGVGGHVEPFDGVENLLRESSSREIGEEVYLDKGINGEPKVLGYIYHDFGVHQVHFGILYLIETLGDAEPRMKDGGISQGKFMSLSELEEICNSPDCDVEEWSRTALVPLTKIL